jgi:hypothetical protein
MQKILEVCQLGMEMTNISEGAVSLSFFPSLAIQTNFESKLFTE